MSEIKFRSRNFNIKIMEQMQTFKYTVNFLRVYGEIKNQSLADGRTSASPRQSVSVCCGRNGPDFFLLKSRTHLPVRGDGLLLRTVPLTSGYRCHRLSWTRGKCGDVAHGRHSAGHARGAFLSCFHTSELLICTNSHKNHSNDFYAYGIEENRWTYDKPRLTNKLILYLNVLK